MQCFKTRFQDVGRAPLRTLALATAIAACLPVEAATQPPEVGQSAAVSFEIPAGSLSEALGRFSTQSGIQVMYRPELVSGKASRSIDGVLEPAVALERLLKGSGLKAKQVNPHTYVLLQDTPATNAQKPGSISPVSVDRDKVQRVEELDQIVVVGSRLKVNPTDSVLPIRIITREEIDRSGAGTIAQVLSALPEVSTGNDGNTSLGVSGGTLSQRFNEINATTVQLRGLPLGSTLVLINGRRTEASSAFINTGRFDLSTIPLSLVERIEVLPSGSSAIYGGDGLAGVVNLVLKANVSGGEIRVRKDAAEGYGEEQVSVAWGKTWARGSLMAQASWRTTGGLTSDERSLTADQDYSRFGGFDRRSAVWANPAVVYSLEGCDRSAGFCGLPLEARGNLPGLNAPVAMVPAGQNGVGLTPQDFVPTSGQKGLSTYQYNIFSPERSRSFMINGDMRLADSITAFGELTYNRRQLASNPLALTVAGGMYGYDTSTIPAENPFNPFGVDVGIDYTFEDTGYSREFSQEYFRGLVGLRGTLWRDAWDWEFTLWRTVDKSHTGKVFAFRNIDLVPLHGSTDPAVAFNAFAGDGSPPLSQAALDAITLPITDGFSSNVHGAHAFIRGSLLKLPAGELMAVLGAERQETKFGRKISVYAEDLDGRDISQAFFGELHAPIVGTGARPMLALTGAYRHESSDRYVDAADTATLGIEYRPHPHLLIRATRSTSFKPPNLYSVSRLERPSRYQVVDPKTDPNTTILVNGLSGGGVSPDLRPETSENTTLGAVFSPSDDWRASFTAWVTDIDDRITQAFPQFFIDHESEFPSRVVRNAQTGAIEVVDTRDFNILGTKASGVDVSLEGRIRSAIGEFAPSLAATYVWEHKEKLTAISNETNSLGVIRNTGWSPEWKIVPRLLLARDDVSTSLTGRYVSSYEDPAALLSGPDAGKTQLLGDFWMFDLNLDIDLRTVWDWGRRLGSGARLIIGANNIFDRLPDYCNQCAAGYDASQYDIFGRRIYAEIRIEL